MANAVDVIAETQKTEEARAALKYVIIQEDPEVCVVSQRAKGAKGQARQPPEDDKVVPESSAGNAGSEPPLIQLNLSGGSIRGANVAVPSEAIDRAHKRVGKKKAKAEKAEKKLKKVRFMTTTKSIVTIVMTYHYTRLGSHLRTGVSTSDAESALKKQAEARVAL
ncbi:hypothetical protein EV356DRAFT_575400 [Viridothelium virens]|uniref:Uncharacterized protein n=1 Tax=Viridothelium virens TaxID=1048519 RepID=A0A6A6HCM7_VIRVR|nr:hypothetical protein EV356DRAFT_575400 [Viridothelium virens]